MCFALTYRSWWCFKVERCSVNKGGGREKGFVVG